MDCLSFRTMARVEKTVFICYRRESAGWALAIFDHLRQHGYDVFIDYEGIGSGDFERIIVENIRARAHFLVLLTPTALDRCSEPDDWLRREIEEALDCRRNIVPLLLEGFDFSSPATKKELVGRVRSLADYNGPTVTAEYFEAAMARLRSFLDVPLEAVLHPASAAAREGARAQQVSAATEGALRDTTTAFVGQAAQGNERPMLLTDWDDFLRHYGPPLGADQSFLALAVRGFFENGGERAYVIRVLPADATVASLTVPTADRGQRLAFRARSAGSAGNRLQVRIRPGSRFGVRITIVCDAPDGAPTEDFDNLSPGDAEPNPLWSRINERSARVAVDWTSSQVAPAMPQSGEWLFEGGSDGHASVSDYVGRAAEGEQPPRGLEAVDALRDVALLCLPDAVHPRFSEDEQTELTQWLTARAERIRAMALLALPCEQCGQANVVAPTESGCAAVFTPWLPVDQGPGQPAAHVPPVGHVAGALARHDGMAGLHVAPLGLGLTGLAEVESLRTLPVVVCGADECARRGVNLLLPATEGTPSVTLAGAVTNSKDTDSSSLSGQRFANYVTRALDRGMAWVATAPSDEATWTRVRTDIEDFFRMLWRHGVLLGDKPEEAFFVRCGRDTMSEEDIRNGRVNVILGYALRTPGASLPSTLSLQARPLGDPPPEGPRS